MPKVSFSAVNASDSRLAQAKASKSSFQRSRFTAGLVLSITGFTWVAKDGEADGDLYPVLTTSLNGQPFDNIFLSTLVRDVQDIDGKDLSADGSFNNLVKTIGDRPTTTTDELWLSAIVQELAGRQVKVNRDRAYKADWFGRTKTLRQLRFDII